MVTQGNGCLDTITIDFTPREIHSNKVQQLTRNPQMNRERSHCSHAMLPRGISSYFYLFINQFWLANIMKGCKVRAVKWISDSFVQKNIKQLIIYG